MSEMTLEQYMELRYAVQVVPDVCTDGTQCYLASYPELPGCMSHGADPEEAIRNLEGARRLYIKTLLKRNLSVPLPETMQSPGIVVANLHTRVEWRVWTDAQPTPTAGQAVTLAPLLPATGSVAAAH